MRAINLIPILALLALQASSNLRTNTDPLSDLHKRNILSNPQHLADNLMTNTDGIRGAAPARTDSVNIGLADSAGLDLNVDVVGLEGLGGVLLRTIFSGGLGGLGGLGGVEVGYLALVESGPSLRILDKETLKLLGNLLLGHGERY